MIDFLEVIGLHNCGTWLSKSKMCLDEEHTHEEQSQEGKIPWRKPRLLSVGRIPSSSDNAWGLMRSDGV